MSRDPRINAAAHTTTPSARERILVALSGGVDSAVAALLLQREGHDIVAAYMKNWINEDGVIGHCPWEQDIEDARAVAGRLGIEFRVVNLIEDYRHLVVDYLLENYQRGLTPNPDVMCNREIKFGAFLRYARAEGFSAVATGHYAQRVHAPDTPGGYRLLEGADKNKDQSYFLALLSGAQLAAARFPIGHLEKPELRRLAAEAGLPNAQKKDSQGICFIGQVKMADFLKAYVPDQPGPILRASDGQRLGEHRGLHYYTLGQRRGIGIPSNTDNKAYVVVGKRATDHALLVAFDEPRAPGLWTHEAHVHGLSFINEPIRAHAQIEARVRYRDPRIPIHFIPETNAAPPSIESSGEAPETHANGSTDCAAVKTATHPAAATSFAAQIRFAAPQRAIAPGQIIALYRGEELLGGGIFSPS
ncbi:tRNA(5-methylaminomethyl-2-thiouridylate)-methyltransferase [Cephaloticoccus primus]|uniref:tRNA-specific 2-thiouridylase MnmA n=1 Tax=Cephaloticoccus primus TaxID=1548207 RepID=A0A139SS21_9BACT|nr:tRNA 2-thiouridine(34) synthase MnmA [Cephaloticoccus primus]KXU37358.1 tRNA(5-methylaminomethyl-2-thiouridylate)-methyltransferase [Cephaloticoccus primus]